MITNCSLIAMLYLVCAAAQFVFFVWWTPFGIVVRAVWRGSAYVVISCFRVASKPAGARCSSRLFLSFYIK